jgi:hypothetical protein
MIVSCGLSSITDYNLQLSKEYLMHSVQVATMPPRDYRSSCSDDNKIVILMELLDRFYQTTGYII